jgi:hypothetical protein
MSVGALEGISISTETVPLCPVTGQPAIRQVQWVSTRLLIDLWRIVFGTDARDSLAGIDGTIAEAIQALGKAGQRPRSASPDR